MIDTQESQYVASFASWEIQEIKVFKKMKRKTHALKGFAIGSGVGVIGAVTVGLIAANSGCSGAEDRGECEGLSAIAGSLFGLGVFILSSLLGLGIGAIVWQFAGAPGNAAIHMAWSCFGLVIPVSGMEHLEESDWRKFHIFFCCAMAVVGIGSVLAPAQYNGLFLLVFVFSLVAYSWITSLGAFASRR